MTYKAPTVFGLQASTLGSGLVAQVSSAAAGSCLLARGAPDLPGDFKKLDELLDRMHAQARQPRR